MAQYTNLYEDIEYPDSGYGETPHAQIVAARRRAKTLRQRMAQPAPLTVSPDDEETAEEYGTEPEFTPAPDTEQAPDINADAVLSAGSGNPAKDAALARAKLLLGGEAPQGRQVGRVFVASSPLETLAHGVRQALGASQMKRALAPGPDAHLAGAKTAMDLPTDQRIQALLMSNDPALQKAGMALLQQQRSDATLAQRTEAERIRQIKQIDLETAKQGGRESLARLRASLARPPTEPRRRIFTQVLPNGQVIQSDQATGAIWRANLPAGGPPPGAAPESPEAKAAETLALDKLPAETRTKYNILDWQTQNLPNIMDKVQNAPPDTFGPGSDMASFVPGESISAVVRTWQDKGRAPAQVEARRAVFSDAYTKIKELAGTAMTQTESNRLREFLPNGNDTPENILAKLRGAYEEAQRQRARVRSEYLPEFPESPAPRPGSSGTAGSVPAPAPAGRAGPPAPTTQAEYDALPAGTVYIHPTKGVQRKR